MFRLHAEARQGRVGKAGTVRELFDATDLTHGFLPFPQSRGRDLHLILLVCERWGGGEVKVEDGDLCIVPKLLYKGMSALPRKVVEMYSDTWFPERLISDKWDSSLFNILLN